MYGNGDITIIILLTHSFCFSALTKWPEVPALLVQVITHPKYRKSDRHIDVRFLFHLFILSVIFRALFRRTTTLWPSGLFVVTGVFGKLVGSKLPSERLQRPLNLTSTLPNRILLLRMGLHKRPAINKRTFSISLFTVLR